VVSTSALLIAAFLVSYSSALPAMLLAELTSESSS
jgi:hypothetical protein